MVSLAKASHRHSPKPQSSGNHKDNLKVVAFLDSNNQLNPLQRLVVNLKHPRWEVDFLVKQSHQDNNSLAPSEDLVPSRPRVPSRQADFSERPRKHPRASHSARVSKVLEARAPRELEGSSVLVAASLELRAKLQLLAQELVGLAASHRAQPRLSRLSSLPRQLLARRKVHSVAVAVQAAPAYSVNLHNLRLQALVPWAPSRHNQLLEPSLKISQVGCLARQQPHSLDFSVVRHKVHLGRHPRKVQDFSAKLSHSSQVLHLRLASAVPQVSSASPSPSSNSNSNLVLSAWVWLEASILSRCSNVGSTRISKNTKLRLPQSATTSSLRLRPYSTLNQRIRSPNSAS